MKINLNLYKKYQQYKQSRPIRVVAEVVEEGCENGCKSCADRFEKMSGDLEDIAKSVSNMADLFETKLGFPPRIEHDFGNGTVLLKRRAKPEELATADSAETGTLTALAD